MWPTILVGAVLAAIVTLAVRSLYKDKKSGKGSCSCGGNCSKTKAKTAKVAMLMEKRKIEVKEFPIPEVGDDDKATFSRGMGIIIRESERLSGIVEELLDFSRMCGIIKVREGPPSTRLTLEFQISIV